MSDLIVAALALEHDLAVFTADSHFRHIHGLRLHSA
jgi:predicted nucleic acid-binding protein